MRTKASRDLEYNSRLYILCQEHRGCQKYANENLLVLLGTYAYYDVYAEVHVHT